MIYLDNSATTRPYDEVIELTAELMRNQYGNPSSLYSFGIKALDIMEEARRTIASTLPPGGRIVFTSGGTESDNTAIFSAVRKNRRQGRRIITTAAEHPAVMETCRRLAEDGWDIVYVPTDADGVMKLSAFEEALNQETILVTMMAVNNETGAIMPVLESYRLVQKFNKKHGTKILFHCDAVQAYGKLDLREAPFDMISASAHKFHGPKGVGFLYIKKGVVLPPHLLGGGQESGFRSGTENVPGIAGMGVAAARATGRMEEKAEHMEKLGETLLQILTGALEDVRVNGPEETGRTLKDAGKRCPSVLNLSFMNTRGEVLLHTLERDEIFVSTGSACSSHKTGDSKVLQAMGMNHREIEGAIRFSFSEENTEEEIRTAAEKVIEAVQVFRRLGSFR